jgi:hypothetical protein
VLAGRRRSVAIDTWRNRSEIVENVGIFDTGMADTPSLAVGDAKWVRVE